MTSLVGTQGRLQGRRVLFVHAWLEHGGSELQSLVLARHLREAEGAHVEVAGFHPGSLMNTCRGHSIPTHLLSFNWERYTRLSRLGRVATIWRVAGQLRRVGADILIPYTDAPSFAVGAAWLTGRTGAQVCLWNQRGVADSMLASSRLAREVARRVTLIVCNAEHLKDRLVRSLQVVPSRVHVIRNAVALNARNSEWDWRAALGIPASAWVACMPANLTPYKDHVTVLHAWQRVAAWAAQQGRAAVLLLAGYFGATANALKRLEYELELTPFIRFLGRVDDVAGVLSAADLCVFASASEGSPNGVLEAMAAGLPVAATEEPGVREALGAAADRQLAPRQPESLGALIASHLSSPEQRRQLGAENRLRIETAYLERRSGEEMANLLVEALARNH